MLNWQLMRHPFNWIIVTLMVVIGSIAVQYLFAASATDDGANVPT